MQNSSISINNSRTVDLRAPPGSFGCTGTNFCTHNTMLETEYQCQTRAVTKGLVYWRQIARKKQLTYRVKLLGPVQEVQVGGQDVADVVRGVLGPQVLAVGVVRLPATICEQTVIAKRPNTMIGQLAMCCKTTINSFLLYNYEQYWGLGRFNTSCTNTYGNRVFPYVAISVYCSFPCKFQIPVALTAG